VGKSLSPIAAQESDAQALLKAIMPAAQASLEQRDGFVPMGALLALDGSVRAVDLESQMAAESSERTASVLPVKEAVDMLRERLRREVRNGDVRSAALAADVMIWRRKDGDQASSAVSVHVEHQDGYCVDLLIPYKVRRGMISRLRKKPQVMFREMIAQESEAVIFSGCAGNSTEKPSGHSEGTN
jgi:hypothetical protein